MKTRKPSLQPIVEFLDLKGIPYYEITKNNHPYLVVDDIEHVIGVHLDVRAISELPYMRVLLLSDGDEREYNFVTKKIMELYNASPSYGLDQFMESLSDNPLQDLNFEENDEDEDEYDVKPVNRIKKWRDESNGKN